MVDSDESRQAFERSRKRNAWALLGTHAVAFVLLLLGFILRLRSVTAEGVTVDPLALILVAAGTVVFIILLALLLVFRRRAGLKKAIAASGLAAQAVYAYWSRLNNPPFLARALKGTPARGFDVAVTADREGLHVRTVVRRKLVDLGLIPWAEVTNIEGARKEVGVGMQYKAGVLTIRTTTPISPYTNWLEFFPLGETSLTAAAKLTDAWALER
jgi:hypothetical protein